MPDHFTPLVEK